MNMEPEKDERPTSNFEWKRGTNGVVNRAAGSLPAIPAFAGMTRVECLNFPPPN